MAHRSDQQIEFPNLRGEGTFVPLNNELPHTQTFDAVLADGTNYFGISTENSSVGIPFYLLRSLWNRAGPGSLLESSIKPTSLNLSAFGIVVGVRVDF